MSQWSWPLTFWRPNVLTSSILPYQTYHVGSWGQKSILMRSQRAWPLTSGYQKIHPPESKRTFVPNLKKWPQDVFEISGLQEWDGQTYRWTSGSSPAHLCDSLQGQEWARWHAIRVMEPVGGWGDIIVITPLASPAHQLRHAPGSLQFVARTQWVQGFTSRLQVDESCDREQICIDVSSTELFLPWTGADTSPAQPPVGPDTPGPRNRTAPTRRGAACTSRRLLGASAVAWRCEGRGKYSHRRTHSSGTGGTASVREDTLLHIKTCTRAVRPTAVGLLTWDQNEHTVRNIINMTHTSHVSVIGYVPYLHSNKMSHVMFTFVVYDLTVTSGGEGGGVTGEEADKPVTTVQGCVCKFLSMKPPDIFYQGLRTISTCV